MLVLALHPVFAAEQPEPRRLEVRVELSESSTAWWRKALGGEGFDGVLLSWGLALLDSQGRVQALPAQPACPRDPSCLEWAKMGAKCAHFIAQGLPEWDERYSCYADGRTIFADEQQLLVEMTVPEGIREARLTLYFRDDELRRKVWPAEVVGGPASLTFRMDPDAGFLLDVRIGISLGSSGRPTGLSIESCRAGGGDPARVAEQMRSAEFRYCESITAEPEAR